MKRILTAAVLIIFPLLCVCAQNIVIISYKQHERIPSGDYLIFSRFLREEVRNQINVLNKKISAENRKIRSSSRGLEEIPRYSLVSAQPRYEEDRRILLLAGENADAEYLITGEISVLDNSYIIDSMLLKVDTGELVKRDRRLVAGLGELTVASGAVAEALLDNGDTILSGYISLNDDILAETDKPDVRETAEVLTDKGVAFRGTFSVVSELPGKEDESPDIGKQWWHPVTRIGGDSIITLSTLAGGLSRRFYTDADILFDEYYLAASPEGMYEDYIKSLDMANGLFWGCFYSFWPGIGLQQVSNIFTPSELYSYSKQAKLLMTIGTGLDSASDIMFLYSSQFGLEARSRHYEDAIGYYGFTNDPGQMYKDNMLVSDILFYSGIAAKVAGLTLRIIAEDKPPEGKRGFWNRGLYLAGSAASAAGTALSWMVFFNHEEAGQAYIDYIGSPFPAEDDYRKFTEYFHDEYLPVTLLTAGVITLGGILKSLSFYIPGPKLKEPEDDSKVSLEVGAESGFIVARLSWQ